MGFGQEIKEFVGGFQAGWKLATPTKTELDYRARKEEKDGLEAAQDSEEGVAGSRTRGPGYSFDRGEGGGAARGGGSKLATFIGQGTEPSWAKAISGIESGGRYDAVGPRHRTMGRALGKYQVMESNVPVWTKEALGTRMTGDQFLKDPSAQDAVFRYKFGDYVKKYGNPQDAASAWHSGRPLSQAARAGARDSLGTSTVDYVRKFSSALGGVPKANPTAAPVANGSFGINGVTQTPGRRAALDLDGEDDRDYTQFAAEGGRVRSREELQEEIRRKATEEDPPEPPARQWETPPTRVTADGGEAPPVQTASAGAIPGLTYASLPPGPEDSRPSWQDPPQEARQSWQDPTRTVTATEPTAPLPPRRPREAAVTGAGNAAPKRQGVPLDGAPLPPKRPADNQLYDNGAQLPGEGLQAGTDEPYDPKRIAHVPGVGDAIQAGMDAIGEFFGFSRKSAGIPDARSGRDDALRRFGRGEGAATREEIQSVDNVIDPKRQLSDDERAVARLYGGYKYYLSRGEPEKAKKYAASMLMYSKVHVQTAGALAEQAIQGGNVPMGAKIIAEAHNEIPDGQSLKIEGATPKGVQFAMYDEDGQLTERGEANVNQLMQMATGMRNGSEWLNQMEASKGRSLSAAQKLKLKQEQSDQEALTNFQGETPDNDFLNSLSPEARAQYDKMTPRLKNQVYQQYKAQTDTRRRGDREEVRNAQIESRAAGAEKKGKDQQEYATHIDTIRDAQEAVNAQMQDDPYDEAKLKPLREKLEKAKSDASKWTTADAGRGSYVPQLNREMRAITRGGAGGVSAGVSGGAAGGAGGKAGTKDERDALRYEESARRAELQARRTKDPADISAAGLARSQAEFQKRDTGDDKDTRAEIDLALPKVLGVKGVEEVPEEKKGDLFDYRDAVSSMMRGGNDMSADQAVGLAEIAARTGKITRNDDGSYSINGSRPVFLSSTGLRALSNLAKRRRGGNDVIQKKDNPFAGVNAATGGEVNTRDYESMKQSLGPKWREGMTAAQMRKLLRGENVSAIALDRENNPDDYRDRNLP